MTGRLDRIGGEFACIGGGSREDASRGEKEHWHDGANEEAKDWN